MDQFITRIRTNLNGVLEMTQMFDGLMMTGDNLANRIIVEVNRDGVPITLSSAEYNITGYVIRNDGYTLDIVGGIYEDGEEAGHAYIDLPDLAYEIPGPLSIAVRMNPKNGTQKIVIATASVYVNMTRTDAIIDPTHRIPDVEELLAYIDDIELEREEIALEEAARQLNEETRQTNEAARETAEATRQSTFETNEATRQSTFETAESGRESTFTTNETARQSTFTTAEAGRESTFTTNEATRQSTFETAESTRQTIFETNETARQINETARVSAESTRQSQETARETAQAARNAMIDGMTVAATGLAPYSDPTVIITEVSGHKHIAFGLTPGDPFVIVKTFASIAEMEAYSGTDLRSGQFVLITSNVEDPDNAKMYCVTGTSPNTFTFVTDLSGAQGIVGPQGVTGNGIASIALNQDYTITVHYTDGTSWTSPNSIRGEKGDTGISISSVTLNADYTITVNFSDGTSWTSPNSIRGEQGPIGETGNGIASAELTEENKIKIIYTDGTTWTSDESIKGDTGATGETGNGIASIVQNQDKTLTITMTDGTEYVTEAVKGDPGLYGIDFNYNSETKELILGMF